MKKHKPQIQKISEINSKDTYWDHVRERELATDNGDLAENVEANPDQLSESQTVIQQRGPRERLALQILDDALDRLTPSDRHVWIASQREAKSNYEIADELGIEETTVRRSLKRSMAEVVAYCQGRAGELDGLI